MQEALEHANTGGVCMTWPIIMSCGDEGGGVAELGDVPTARGKLVGVPAAWDEGNAGL